MTRLPESLRATSDALLRDLEALVALEEEKRTLEPSDSRLVELAAQVEVIAGRVLARSGEQRALSEAAVVAPPGMPAIEDVLRSPAAILAEWREAERRAAAAAPGSAEATEAGLLIERLREEYRVAFEASRRR
ncbi:MAG: hypothetical protein AB1627_08995 [Chloroflexota bacterium]